MDVAREQVPEGAADDDPERHPDDRPHAHRHRRLPGHRRGQLALGEPEGLQQGQVPPTPADRGQQGEAERDDRPGGQGGPEDRRRTPDGAVVGDLGGAQHTDDAARAVRRGAERRVDPSQRTSGQGGVRPVTEADEVGVGTRHGALLEVARRGRDDPVVEHGTGPHFEVLLLRADRRHRGGSHDGEPRLGWPLFTVTTSPTCLCSSARVVAPRSTWFDCSKPFPERSGGCTGAPGSAPRTGTVRPSNSSVSKYTPVKADTYGSWLSRRSVWPCGEVLVAREARQQHGVPVPPVERRMRDEGVQAGSEGERGGHHGDGQDGTEDRRADGTALRPVPGSRAKRTPATVGAGRPEEAAAWTTTDERSTIPRLRAATRCGAPGRRGPPTGRRGRR